MIESIGQYYEVRPNGRRHFELFKDRLIVKTKTARVDSEITLKLVDLRPEPNRIRVRPKEFGLGILLLVVSIGLAIVGVFALGLDPARNDKNVIWLCIAAGCCFVSLVIFSKTARKIEFMQFVSQHGIILLDVARAGPQRDEFDSFVQTLISQICANQKNDASAVSNA